MEDFGVVLQPYTAQVGVEAYLKSMAQGARTTDSERELRCELSKSAAQWKLMVIASTGALLAIAGSAVLLGALKNRKLYWLAMAGTAPFGLDLYLLLTRRNLIQQHQTAVGQVSQIFELVRNRLNNEATTLGSQIASEFAKTYPYIRSGYMQDDHLKHLRELIRAKQQPALRSQAIQLLVTSHEPPEGTRQMWEQVKSAAARYIHPGFDMKNGGVLQPTLLGSIPPIVV